MPRRWTHKGKNTVATLGNIVVRMEALVITKRLSTLKTMILMHKPELMKTEPGRKVLEHMSTYLTKLQTSLRPRTPNGE